MPFFGLCSVNKQRTKCASRLREMRFDSSAVRCANTREGAASHLLLGLLSGRELFLRQVLEHPRQFHDALGVGVCDRRMVPVSGLVALL